MAIALALIGIIFIVSAAKGTEAALGTQLVSDFTGQSNFFYWVAAIIVIGAIGYIKPLRSVSWGILVLILLVMFLANGTGFWAQLTSALAGASPATAPAPATATSAQGTAITPSNTAASGSQSTSQLAPSSGLSIDGIPFDVSMGGLL